MNSTSSRLRLASATSPFALAMSLVMASPAQAQADPATQAEEQAAAAADAANEAAAAADDAAEAADSAIVVTGFRAALQSAVSTKKRNDQIVESVSAEDIGKLPDNSIAESIARLPGLAAQRTQGRASIISIRGFGPDFSVTTLNCR